MAELLTLPERMARPARGGLLGLLLGACVPSIGPSLRPIEPVEPTPLQWTAVVPLRVAQADGISVATITKVQEDWTYDRHCGIVAQILGRCTGMTFTEKVTLDGKLDLWTWTTGDFGLHPAERAVFVWRYVYAVRAFECEERGGMSSQSCQWDKLPALTDDLDVLPLADSARVDSLFRRGRHAK